MKTTIYGQDDRVVDFVTSLVEDLEFHGKVNNLGVEIRCPPGYPV